MLRPNSQPSPFRSWPAGFENGWPVSKQAGLIHNRLKILARFETGWVDGFKTGWVDGFKTGWVDGFKTCWVDSFETCWWTLTRYSVLTEQKFVESKNGWTDTNAATLITKDIVILLFPSSLPRTTCLKFYTIHSSYKTSSQLLSRLDGFDAGRPVQNRPEVADRALTYILYLCKM